MVFYFWSTLNFYKFQGKSNDNNEDEISDLDVYEVLLENFSLTSDKGILWPFFFKRDLYGWCIFLAIYIPATSITRSVNEQSPSLILLPVQPFKGWSCQLSIQHVCLWFIVVHIGNRFSYGHITSSSHNEQRVFQPSYCKYNLCI